MPWTSLALLVTLALGGCATLETTRTLPPAELLQDCPAPVEDFSTNGGLAKARNAWKRALESCNLDKKALREWAES